MNKKIYYILSLLICSVLLYGQETNDPLLGKVSYVTSRNIYVKFENTSTIEIGDTLFNLVNGNETPCLLVTQKSSTSCVCSVLNECVISKDHEIIFKKIIPPVLEQSVDKNPGTEPTLVLPTETTSIFKPVLKPKYQEHIRGRISAASYSQINPESIARHRMMYRFSLNASHINNSKFSFESYINYRQNLMSKSDASSIQTNFLRVYNLAFTYQADSTLSFLVGRKINRRVSSLGAIDGLQTEKYFGNFYTGLIVGFRPDIIEYDFNPNLLEYGAYIGLVSKKEKAYSQSTLGLLEQKNNHRTDRRYAYFQHSSTLNNKLNLFSSFEIDLFNHANAATLGDLRLTNLYISARYKFSRKLNISVAYDSRKRILFYETLKTEIERLLDNDETRQGFRARINLRPFKLVNVGLSIGKRFQSDRQNKSDNINGYLSLSRVPLIKGRFSFNFNLNSSNYLESKIVSFRYGRELFKHKVNADVYYRHVDYNFYNAESQSIQHYYGGSVSYRINKNWRFHLLGEIVGKDQQQNYRMNTKLTKRFGKKSLR